MRINDNSNFTLNQVAELFNKVNIVEHEFQNSYLTVILYVPIISIQ